MSCAQMAIDSGTLKNIAGGQTQPKQEVTLAIQTESGEVVTQTLSLRAARYSDTLKGAIDADEGVAQIPLARVTERALPHVVAFLEHMCGEDEEEMSKNGKLTDWEQKFCDVDDDLSFDLITAADYLESKRMLHVMATKFAEEVKGKTSEQIRERYNIPNDLTEEEMERIKKEMDWIEEDDDEDDNADNGSKKNGKEKQ